MLTKSEFRNEYFMNNIIVLRIFRKSLKEDKFFRGFIYALSGILIPLYNIQFNSLNYGF